jgi:hypothetical protein
VSLPWQIRKTSSEKEMEDESGQKMGRSSEGAGVRTSDFNPSNREHFNLVV